MQNVHSLLLDIPKELQFSEYPSESFDLYASQHTPSVLPGINKIVLGK